MNKKSKILIIIAMLVFTLSISMNIYAYFNASAGDKNMSARANINDDNVVEISSFYDLVKYGTSETYNDDTLIKEASSDSLSDPKPERKVLKLTSNITIATNIVLTEDIQIDLNTKTLNLNDNIITFKHGYAGCGGIYNGYIESGSNSSGKIVVDLINSGFVTSDLDYTSNDVATTEDTILEILNIDEKYTAYSALYLVANSINSSLNARPKFEDYFTVSSNSFNLSIDKFIPSTVCEISGETEYCSFVYKDLDLPNHYLSSDITISYSSSVPTVLANNGKVSITANNTDVVLTATISREGWENDYELDFDVHVVKLTDTTTKNKVAKSLIESYILPYKNDEALVVLETVYFSDYYYGFEYAIELPNSALDGTITYTYSVTDYLGTSEITGRMATKGDTTYFEPSTSCFHLVINGDAYNMYSTYVSTKESAAYLILNYLYGGSIIYDKTYASLTLETVSTINAGNNTAVKSLISEHGVTAINYQFKALSDVNTYYSLSSNVLSLQSNSIPPDKVGYITVTFTFDDSTTIAIDVYVDYLDSSGSVLSSFLTYYSIIDPTVPTELLTSFDMPFAYNDSTTSTPHLIAPYIVYDFGTYTTSQLELADHTMMNYYNVTYDKPANLKISLYYNGSIRYTFSQYGNTPVSFSNQLDSYLSTNGLTLAQIAQYSDAKYIFSINAQESLTVNKDLIIIYNYKFANDVDWHRYANTVGSTAYLTDLNTTPITVLGGLFYNADGETSSGVSVDHAVRSNTFFIWIYNKFKPSTEAEMTNAKIDTSIIPINWLSQDIEISSSDTSLRTVSDYSGIGYLKNVTTVDLSGVNLSTSTLLSALANMPSLTTLKLSGCSISNISALSNLTTVKVLDISNNNIQYFDSLADVTCLEKIYLYGNNNTNKYYGSTGICNYQAFADLMRNGCAVYNAVSNDVPILYAESNSLDDYRRLKSIAYQDKLKKGLDITNLYSRFVAVGTTITNVAGNNRPGNNPFGLQTAGTLQWGYEPGKSTGDATYFYCTLTYTNGGYKLTVKYYVERY